MTAERLAAAGLAQAALGQPRLIGGPHAVGVVAEAVANASGSAAAVSKRQRHGVLGLPRHDPGRPNDTAIADRDFDMIAICDGHALRQRRTDRDDVTPGQRRQRLRQFLQPTDIGKLSVPDGRVGPEDDVEAFARGLFTASDCLTAWR